MRLAPLPRPVAASGDLLVVRAAVLVTGLLAAFGMVARVQIILNGLAKPGSTNIFYRLYALHERPFLLLVAIAAVATGVVARLRVDSGGVASSTPLFSMTPPRWPALAVVAGLVFVVSFAAAHLVMHGLLFSMDEFSVDFQARLFAAGRYAASLPPAWQPYASGITPIFVTYRPDGASWLSVYLPGYALLKAPFIAMHAPDLLNPLLAALTVLALGGVARHLWPGEGTRPWLAVALLATSSQFLLTSGTGYTMPAHLCLNIVWLWLYLRGDRWSWIAALGVGVLALGLHNPFPHALFVTPFLVRLLRERRWKRLGSALLVYGAAAVMWLAWLRMAFPAAQTGGGVLLSFFALPDKLAVWLNAVSLSLLFTWQAPLFGLLAVAAVLRLRLIPPLSDLAWGVLLTLVFYLFFPSSQGHGWGHRYAHQVLGSLALLGAAGVAPLCAALGARRAQLLVALSLLIAVLVQLPARVLLAERFVRPFADGYAYLMTRPADVVLVHGDSIWYGRDMVRNDPFLRGQPVVVRAGTLAREARDALERAHPGRVVEVKDGELLRLGMTPWTSHEF